MEKSNKKFWSFIVGSILATGYIWLVEFGLNAAVPSSFHGEANFIVSYYPTIITGGASFLVAVAAVFIMSTLLNTKVSDHVFWLILPTLSFLTFSLLSANVLLMSLLSAAIPTLLVFLVAYVIEMRDMFMPERMKVW